MVSQPGQTVKVGDCKPLARGRRAPNTGHCGIMKGTGGEEMKRAGLVEVDVGTGGEEGHNRMIACVE